MTDGKIEIEIVSQCVDEEGDIEVEIAFTGSVQTEDGHFAVIKQKKTQFVWITPDGIEKGEKA